MPSLTTSMGMDSVMPAKIIKLHINDAPWMTGHLKHLIKCRQKALKDNCPTQLKFYHNQVNRERKHAKVSLSENESFHFSNLR